MEHEGRAVSMAEFPQGNPQGQEGCRQDWPWEMSTWGESKGWKGGCSTGSRGYSDRQWDWGLEGM